MSDYNDGILPEPCLRMDTHFGDEYESIEFGDGTGYIKAAPILAKVGVLYGEIDRLRDESAKLRELVRRLYNMADFCRNCPDTERCDVDVEWLGCTVADPIDKLMDELGVNV